VLPPVVRSA
jgi:hypothetical protein